MKKFKKIYIEITNVCNLNCSFCSIDNRKKESISTKNFERIMKKINDYTDYIYLHVKGEPLLHPNLLELLDIAYSYNKKVNITTNGTLLKEKKDILKHPAIRQINISLHSENNKKDYLKDILETIKELKNKIIVLRYWTLKEKEELTEIVDKVLEHYNLSTDVVDKSNHLKLEDNLYLDKQLEFVWPSLDNDYYNEHGMCYALRDQLAILVDGTVIPCCLDSKGIINLGNIYDNSLEEIINSKRYQDMLVGFRNRCVTEELCKKCSFKDRLLTNN